MKQKNIPAYGKINLTLDVLGKRPDGYHNVEMIMQSVELHDQIILSEKEDEGIEIRCNSSHVPTDENNLAYQAADLLMKEAGVNKGVTIQIIKKIPVAAGLAGGSTDAAAVLKGLNSLLGLKVSEERLKELGAQLGADVPFCINGGTVKATGIGTELTSLSSLPELELVMVKPDIGVSTKKIYTNYKEELITNRPDTAAMEKAIEARDIEGIKDNMVNVLEDITLSIYPEVAEIKEKMEELGDYPVLMSGSGPTLFAVINNRQDADEYSQLLKEKLEVQVIRTQTR